MKTNNKPTYISLFSSAGIGCYGFKLEGFDCVATNELITRRLDIQKFNNKCKYESGYICGDITEDATKSALYAQLDLWRKKENVSRIDVVIATPPCQGMSVANHKKSATEIVRNSLVIESIKIIKQINPRFFIFENVPAFMKTICTDIDGTNKTIAEAIENNLGAEYSYISRIINFKNHGACSSRQRTVVIGVSKDYADEVSPLELYPDLVEEKTLRQVIGDLKPLTEFGEIDENDIYHSFRVYPEHMRAWISDIKEGESAFDGEVYGTLKKQDEKFGIRFECKYDELLGAGMEQSILEKKIPYEYYALTWMTFANKMWQNFLSKRMTTLFFSCYFQIRSFLLRVLPSFCCCHIFINRLLVKQSKMMVYL